MAQIAKSCLNTSYLFCSSDCIRRVKELPPVECALGNVFYMTAIDEIYVLSYDKTQWVSICDCNNQIQFLPEL